ncbi:MAG TPA: hypothetical protein P5080_01395 [Candidatus Paceibacterota bacterium]|nr:hypothetical protein [Candidatus Pacearchaeota archaeon]HRZ50755.1 hypothetical protein [Candidatus Paceibacterota bacterium]HSA36348.1 hypothetical protein [Candidatus Paceibacterota bacterium]
MDKAEVIEVKKVVLEPGEYEVIKILVKEFASGGEDSGLLREEIKEQLKDLIPLVALADLALIEKEIGLPPGTLAIISAMAVQKALEEASGSITVFTVNKE